MAWMTVLNTRTTRVNMWTWYRDTGRRITLYDMMIIWVDNNKSSKPENDAYGHMRLDKLLWTTCLEGEHLQTECIVKKSVFMRCTWCPPYIHISNAKKIPCGGWLHKAPDISSFPRLSLYLWYGFPCDVKLKASAFSHFVHHVLYDSSMNTLCCANSVHLEVHTGVVRLQPRNCKHHIGSLYAWKLH